MFPRRTSYTPTDPLAFVGDPPLWLPDADEVHVSCAFSWDRPESERLAEAWERHYPGRVKLGGPAYGSESADFVPGRYVKQGVTFTSRGCPRRCPFCLVPEREGKIRLLAPIAAGHIVQDNNLLACPTEHRAAVYSMLATQPRAAVFSGGLDCRLIDDSIAAELRSVRISEVFLAADTRAALKPLRAATERLTFLGRRKLRCYVLIGFERENVWQARERLEAVWSAGALPFAQLYRDPKDSLFCWPDVWRDLQREWSRPAAMYANHKEVDS